MKSDKNAHKKVQKILHRDTYVLSSKEPHSESEESHSKSEELESEKLMKKANMP
ncbi:MAG: hypothetical protein AB1299_07585 [Thermoproteota archaeon]